MEWRNEILGLSEEDRLPAALDMIHDLMGGSDAVVTHWRRALNIPPAIAVVFGCLIARPGQVIPRSTIADALEFRGLNSGEGNSTVSVYVSRLRHRLSKLGLPDAIKATPGAGYEFDANTARTIKNLYPFDPSPAVDGLDRFVRAGRKWSREDDDDLKRMYLRRDALSVIAYELDRSERAVLDRASALGLRARKPVVLKKPKRSKFQRPSDQAIEDYLRHISGVAIRQIARERSMYPSTILRCVRRVEDARDNPDFDREMDRRTDQQPQ